LSTQERRTHVLLLDDDPDDRALARLVLAAELPGLAVEEAADALAFARACGRRSFDLVVLEWELGWTDGAAVLAALKEDWPGVPVIVFTRSESGESALRAVRLGADDYLVKKPAAFLRLAQAVRTALERDRTRGAAGAAPSRPLLDPSDTAARGRALEETASQSLRLRRANEELRQFASLASHELQEPVRMMERYTRLLEEELAGKLGGGADELIEVVVTAARRLRLLIESLLSFSRLETREPRVETAGAEEILARALANLQAMIEESGATVEHTPLPEIEADASQVAQLFQNLVSNAIKFRGDEPPRVHVSAKQGPQEWIFAVRDNGRGIAPAETEAVFTLFKRLHPEIPGSGIGLALCKKIVELHGGRIWVRPHPAGGSTFFFTIPTRPPAA
jgi:signal transduction histidine kinase